MREGHCEEMYNEKERQEQDFELNPEDRHTTDLDQPDCVVEFTFRPNRESAA